MKTLKPSTKLFLANTVVFLVYTIAMSIQPRPDAGLWCGLIVINLAIDFVLMIVFFASKRKDLGLATLLGAAVVLLVGFGTCASLGKLDIK